jgi:hypothetical protein
LKVRRRDKATRAVSHTNTVGGLPLAQTLRGGDRLPVIKPKVGMMFKRKFIILPAEIVGKGGLAELK